MEAESKPTITDPEDVSSPSSATISLPVQAEISPKLPLQVNLALFSSQMTSSLNHFVDLAIDESNSGTSGEGVDRLKKMLSFQNFVSNSTSDEVVSQTNAQIAQNLNPISSKLVETLTDRIGLPKRDSKTSKTPGKSPEKVPAPTIISSGVAARISVELLPFLPDFNPFLVHHLEIRHGVDLIARLADSLDSCTRNRAICSQSGLLQAILDSIRAILLGKPEGSGPHFPEPLTTPSKLPKPQKSPETPSKLDLSGLFRVLETMAGFSITSQEYSQWISLISDCTACTGSVLPEPNSALPLSRSLENALGKEDSRGPSHSFEFDGEQSGLLGPGDARWPFSSGYSFASWIYVESFEESSGASVGAASMAASIAAAASARIGRSSASSAAAAASCLAGEGMAYFPRLFRCLGGFFLSISRKF